MLNETNLTISLVVLFMGVSMGGTVAECLKHSPPLTHHGAQGPELKTGCRKNVSKTPIVYPAENGSPGFVRVEEGEGGEEWHPTSVTPMPVQVNSFTVAFLDDHWVRDRSTFSWA